MDIDDTLSRLTAGLAADEAIALAASPNAWRPDIWQNQHGREFLVVADVTIGAPAFAISDESNAEHIARQDPKTTLRRVAAIRRILDRHTEAESDSALSDRDAGFEAGMYAALEMLADIYPEDTGETEGTNP